MGPKVMWLFRLTLLALVDTLLQYVDTFLLADTIVPPLVHRTERDIDSHSVSRVGDYCFCAEIIDPVKMGQVGRRVVTSEKEIYRVWFSRSERLGQRATNPGGSGWRKEGSVVSADDQPSPSRQREGMVTHRI